MISHLIGILEHIDKNQVVVEVNNIGYQVNVPASVLSRLPKVGEKIKLFTIQVVREDDISLYGFLNKEERSLFSLLLSVSGIGPKSAMTVLSGFPLERLVSAIAQSDIELLTSVPGIGRKTAERIVLELKEKISKAYAIQPGEMATGVKGDKAIISDSIAALISLGYSPREAREVILKLDTEKLDSVEAVIKLALRNLT
jgi:Holliday junction DNA helicase RuvA